MTDMQSLENALVLVRRAITEKEKQLGNSLHNPHAQLSHWLEVKEGVERMIRERHEAYS